MDAQAQLLASRSLADLTRAAQSVTLAQANQLKAQMAARSLPSAIQNGLSKGGLQVDPGVATDPSLWQNARSPVQSTAQGQTTVSIQQTARRAILTWKTFNVGKNTTVDFNQSAGTDSTGNNNWVALNRIVDPSGVPSQIRGSIKADGSVYLINQNGILFGGSSEVNVHSLIASSLDIGQDGQTLAQRNAQFLNLGLNIQTSAQLGPQSGPAGVSADSFSSYSPFSKTQEGAVSVAAGAQITTSVFSPDNPGSVILIGPQVTNAGTISAPVGQVILAATRAIGFYDNTTASADPYAPYIGLVPVTNPSVILKNAPDLPFPTPDFYPGALAVNSGLIVTQRGNITMQATSILNSGVLEATTSISRNGSILLNGVTDTTIGSDAVIAILPEENGESILQGQVSAATFAAPYIRIDAAGTNHPTDPSALNGDVTLNANASVIAPGGHVTLFGASRVYVESGGLVDVAGLTTATLPLSDIFLTITLHGPELADSPLQRNGPLRNQTVTVDTLLSGVRSDGLSWIGSPLIDNVASYAAQVPVTIDQLLSAGGTVAFATQATATGATNANAVILRAGSTIDTSGGFLTVPGGIVGTTQLLGSDGKIYDIGNANPNLTYSGVLGQSAVDHPRWGVTSTYDNPLTMGAHSQSGYVVGLDAGGVTFASSTVIADGRLLSSAVPGSQQKLGATTGTASSGYPDDTRARQANYAQLPVGGYVVFDPSPNGLEALDRYLWLNLGLITQGNTAPSSPNYLIQTTAGSLPDGFGPTTSVPVKDSVATLSRASTAVISTSIFNAAGFSQISLNADPGIAGTAIREVAGATLSVADGGTLSLTAGQVTVSGGLIARSGTISITSNGPGDPTVPPGSPSIVIGPDAILNVRGRWTNDAFADANSELGAAYTNGGSIKLISKARISTDPHDPNTTIDTTGGIAVDPTALLDLTGGGYVTLSGVLQAKNGVPIGRGGNLTIETYAGGYSAPDAGTFPTSGPLAAGVSIDMASSVKAFGFSGGGTLTLQIGPAIAIADAAAGQPTSILQTSTTGTLSIASQFFGADNPFGTIDLESDYGGITVGAGAHLQLRQSNLQSTAAATSLGSGGDIYSVADIATTPAYQRNPANLTLGSGAGDVWHYASLAAGAGDIVIGQNARIIGDPRSTIALKGAVGVQVLGSIVAPGGTVDIAANFAGSTGTVQVGSGTVSVDTVYLGPSSVIDVSGTTLIDTTNRRYVSGTVLAGGAVTLQAGQFGYVALDGGSAIALNGASGTLQFAATDGQNPAYVTETVASDAGQLTLAASTVIGSPSVHATGGGPAAANGTLTILPDSASVGAIILQRDAALPKGFTVGGTLQSDLVNNIYLSASDLNATGYDDINFGVYNSTTGTGGVNQIIFKGDVSLAARRAIVFAGPIGEVSASTGGTAPHVTVGAAYLTFGPVLSDSSVLPDSGIGSFTASAQSIVLESGWIDAARVTLNAVQDVQLVSPISFSDPSAPVVDNGGLVATGDLTIAASEIYPEGGATGVLQSYGKHGRITLLSHGIAAMPLTAGGSIYVLASAINQDGVLRAPGGTIYFGTSQSAISATGDPTASLIAAQSLNFGKGSITSVALDGATLPYGGTVDGQAWYYNDPQRAGSPLSAPPSKAISLNARTVDIGQGATIDISGGGNLYATEFVPGNGGTRNVLLPSGQYSATQGTVAALGNQVPQVFAILPGNRTGIAPNDIDFVTSQGAVAPPSGLSVTLSGSRDLPAGTYLLLPAQYATLPGAYRVIVQPGQTNFQPGQNTVLGDGTAVVSGRFSNAATGEASGTTYAFQVQSSAVWRQYSEIDQASANTFFSAAALKAGTVTPRLPTDAGQLVIAASKALTLDGALRSNAPSGALGSLVDITAQDIQIVAPGATAAVGYLAIDVAQLDAFGADSLLIGGVRGQTIDGTTIAASAYNVEISTDAANPLTGPDILLVTRADPKSFDTTGANGIRIDAGASIVAKGVASSWTEGPITIGHLNAGAADPLSSVSGDGAFLSVSNGQPIAVVRQNVPGVNGIAGTALGALTIGAGALVAGGNALVLDGAGSIAIADSARISGTNVAISSSAIGVGQAPVGARGASLSSGILDQLTGSHSVTLQSAGAIAFYGDVNFDLASAGSVLKLVGGGLSDQGGGTVTLLASALALGNASGVAAVAGAAGNGDLTLKAGEIDIGAGTVGIGGFASVTLSATGRLATQGVGSVDFGGANLSIVAPQFVAETGSKESVTTAGAVTASNGGQATTLATGGALGGALTIKGASIAVDTAIVAPSGTISLEAVSGDVTLGSHAVVDVSGYAQTFFDVVSYAGGGTVDLTADKGSVTFLAGSLVDVSGSTFGGDAGSLNISAISAGGGVALAGTITGVSKSGLGGSLSIDSGRAVALDGLAATLGGAGFTQSVFVRTRAGNLALSSTLSAANVSLVADSGTITVTGTIDASGKAGGQIGLFGAAGVDLEGRLVARGSNPADAGGNVEIGTRALATAGLNATYGFENVTTAGMLTLGAGASIDVSGGTVAGLTGGTVAFRVPLLDSGSIDVNVKPGATITGAHDVVLDAYATWKTSDPGSGAMHFDGIIDPAGWYGSNGKPLATNASGAAIAPGTINTNHAAFYQTNLIGFVHDYFDVQAPAALAALGPVDVRPGIALVNDSAAVNGGNITVSSNWNLGAGGLDSKGGISLFYRTKAGESGALTLQAVNSVNVRASLSDGFFQTGNRLDPTYQTILANVYLAIAPAGSSTSGFDVVPLYAPAVPYDSNDPTYRAQVGSYFAAYGTSQQNGYAGAWSAYFNASSALTGPSHLAHAGVPKAPNVPNPTAYGTYAAYLSAYNAYLQDYQNSYLPAAEAANSTCGGCSVYQAPTAPISPAGFDPGVLKTTGVFVASASPGLYGANGPANAPSANDPNPTTSANLFPLIADPSGSIVGSDGTHYRALSSWSYTIVGGADLSSADPLSVRPVSQFSAAIDGSVTVAGHTSFADTTGVAAAVNGQALAGLVPTTVRTGTGSIIIAAGNDFALTDLSTLPAATANSTDPAPGVVYTAGRASAPLPDPGFVSVNNGAAINGSNSTAHLNGSGDGTGATTVTDGYGFAAPSFGDSYAGFLRSADPLTEPAYPEAGGTVIITAQNDVIGVESTIDKSGKYTGIFNSPMAQFWSQWLLTQSLAAPDFSSLNSGNYNATQGLYDPNAQYLTGRTGAQTSWWINFGSFDQGVAALGGGNVTVSAGHDIRDFSASTPTTGRVSGGLRVKNADGSYTVTTPRLVVTGGGNLTVTAGNDILSGSYYVGIGKGHIAAGGEIRAAGWSYNALNPVTFETTKVLPATVLALGDAQLTVTARGAIDIGAVVNPTYLTGPKIVTGDDVVAKNGGAADIAIGSAGSPAYLDTGSINSYSQASSVQIASLSGNVVFDSLPAYSAQSFGIGSSLNQLFMEPSRLAPATVSVTAFRGDVSVANGFDQSNANDGTLALLAYGSLTVADSLGGSLLGSVNPPTFQTLTGGPAIATYQEVNVETITTKSPVPGLISTAFDPANPANGYDGSSTQAFLLHQGDTSPIRLYALNGDVVNGPNPAAIQAGTATSQPLLILADKPVFVRSGRDIQNLMLYGQNLAAGDVTLIGAGRDIGYTLTSNPNFPISLGSNVIQVAGPGSLVISAGRNLGPFATDFNGTNLAGVATSGNVAWVAGYEDPLLPVGGASVDMLAGVGPGIDYQAVIRAYIDPANAASAPQNYLPELAQYLASLGLGDALSPDQAWAEFQRLDQSAQQAFVDRVFFDEIKATQTSASAVNYRRGYEIINAMFPDAYGYTKNNLTGGANGASQTVQTGNLDLRSSTIQTRQGGSISVFVPGGDILLGSTVSRAIYNQPGETGILTFRGGDINVFADSGVTVNQSRILTEEGGNVVVWSSNGDILAGIGAKTSASYPPYTVLFDSDGLQSLNPAGLVTGAGIGALLTVPNQDPADSNAYLIAPRGTIDAGDAGIRVAGNLFVSAVTVANTGNIQVGGKSQGVPAAAAPAIPSVAASAADAAVAQVGEDAASKANRLAGNDAVLPTLITVDILGFGDDSGDAACRDDGKAGTQPGC